MYDADLAGYFDTIPHDKLLKAIEMRIADRSVLGLIRQWLKSPVVERGAGGGSTTSGRPDKGTPQGGVISPLLANIYLHWFERVFYFPSGPAHWAKARLVRYADDFVVMARYQSKALVGFIETKLEGWLGLTINREKTRVVNLKTAGASLDFLGYTFRYDRDLKGRDWKYLNVAPSQKALAREREQLRQMTSARMCFKPLPVLVGELNRHLRGWANYFSLGYPRMAYRRDQCLHAAATGRPSAAAQPASLPAAGRDDVVCLPGADGSGVSVMPCECLRQELSGEPDAGNPHVRFDEGE